MNLRAATSRQRADRALHQARRIAALDRGRNRIVRVVLAIISAGIVTDETNEKIAEHVRGIDGTNEQLDYIPAAHTRDHDE